MFFVSTIKRGNNNEHFSLFLHVLGILQHKLSFRSSTISIKQSKQIYALASSIDLTISRIIPHTITREIRVPDTDQLFIKFPHIYLYSTSLTTRITTVVL